MKNILLLVLIGFVGCIDHNDDTEDKYYDLGVINHAGSSYLITTDAGVKLMTETLPVDLEFDDNLRVIVKYSILKPAGGDQDFDYWVYVDEIEESFTKEIITINDANRDTLGSSPVEFHDVWITQDYLTVYFTFYAGNKDHYFNLTYDEQEQSDDSFILLTFRHDDNDDIASQTYTGYISFKLNSLRDLEKSEINIHFRGKQFNNVEYLLDDLVYKY